MTKANRIKIIPVLNSFIGLSISIALSACSSSQKAPLESVEANNPAVSQSSNPNKTTTSYYQDKNRESSYPYTTKGSIFSEPANTTTNSITTQLYSIEQLINSKQYTTALSKAEAIDKNTLKANENASLELAKSSIYSAQNQHNKSLDSLRQVNSVYLSQEQTSHYYWIKARSLYLTQNYTGALEALATRNDLLLDSKQKANNERMMSDITNSLSDDEINIIKTRTRNTSLLAWLSQSTQRPLSPLLNSDSINLNQGTKTKIKSTWLQSSPRKIALLLPLSSRFSKSALEFKNGFERAHTQTFSYKPIIQVYDTDLTSIDRLITKANRENADFIVGPLGTQLSSQALSTRSKAPILAIGSQSQAQRNFTFSLSPEVEIKAIVQHARAKGLKSALVFTPQSTRGDRLAASFNQLWKQSGGTVTTHLYNSNEFDHTEVIKSAMGINSSENRHLKLNNTLGIKTKFSASKKENIDMIFLASSLADARNLKPQLNYYDGHKVPTYATSSLNSNMASTAEKADLDGIIIPEMPSRLNSKNISKLNALGFDSYQLIPIIENLKNSNLAYTGMTGEISINPRGNAQRKPTWATFNSGELKPL